MFHSRHTQMRAAKREESDGTIVEVEYLGLKPELNDKLVEELEKAVVFCESEIGGLGNSVRDAVRRKFWETHLMITRAFLVDAKRDGGVSILRLFWDLKGMNLQAANLFRDSASSQYASATAEYFAKAQAYATASENLSDFLLELTRDNDASTYFFGEWRLREGNRL